MDTSAEAMRANDGEITHERILESLFGRELGQGMMMGAFFGTRESNLSHPERLSAILLQRNRPKE
jgi:hypothetical protein